MPFLFRTDTKDPNYTKCDAGYSRNIYHGARYRIVAQKQTAAPNGTAACNNPDGLLI